MRCIRRATDQIVCPSESDVQAEIIDLPCFFCRAHCCVHPPSLAFLPSGFWDPRRKWQLQARVDQHQHPLARFHPIPSDEEVEPSTLSTLTSHLTPSRPFLSPTPSSSTSPVFSALCCAVHRLADPTPLSCSPPHVQPPARALDEAAVLINHLAAAA
jgi:hypothetical protein